MVQHPSSIPKKNEQESKQSSIHSLRVRWAEVLRGPLVSALIAFWTPRGLILLAHRSFLLLELPLGILSSKLPVLYRMWSHVVHEKHKFDGHETAMSTQVVWQCSW